MFSSAFILSLPGKQKLELMPYHGISSGKYEALGMDNPLDGIGSLDSVDEYAQVLSKMGVQVVGF